MNAALFSSSKRATSLVVMLAAGVTSCLRAAELPDDWPCRTTSDCPSEKTCVQSRCHEPGYCESSKDCGPDQVCEDSECQDRQVLTPPDCDGSNAVQVCGGFACVGGSCLTSCRTYGCADGFTCSADRCQPSERKANGQPCNSSDACVSGACCLAVGSLGQCSRVCQSLSLGEPCEADAECISLVCDSGACSTCRGDKACRAQACGNTQCGIVAGFTCGECAMDQVCWNGACATLACDVNTAFFCDGRVIRQCLDGVETPSVATCSGAEFCEPGQVTCQAYSCQSDLGFCKQERFYRCDAQAEYDGLPPNDCGALGLDCTHLGCGARAVDQVEPGGGPFLEGQTTCGNVYLAEQTVSLVSLTQGFSAGGGELHWFAYVSHTMDGPYVSAYPTQRYVTTVGQTNSSPDLDVLLEAGNFYFLGVSGDGISFVLNADATATQTVSFGQLVGGRCSQGGLQESLGDLSSLGTAPQQLTTVDL